MVPPSTDAPLPVTFADSPVSSILVSAVSAFEVSSSLSDDVSDAEFCCEDTDAAELSLSALPHPLIPAADKIIAQSKSAVIFLPKVFFIFIPHFPVSII